MGETEQDGHHHTARYSHVYGSIKTCNSFWNLLQSLSSLHQLLSCLSQVTAACILHEVYVYAGFNEACLTKNEGPSQIQSNAPTP